MRRKKPIGSYFQTTKWKESIGLLFSKKAFASLSKPLSFVFFFICYFPFKRAILRHFNASPYRQNAEEYPLAKMSEEFEARKKKEDELATGGKREEAWKAKQSEKMKKGGEKGKSEWRPEDMPPIERKPIKVTTIDGKGKATKFPNLEEMRKHFDARVDDKVEMRTDRTHVFRDPNPWTYSVEEAAQLGLLSEIPKDYEKKKRDKRIVASWNKKYGHRKGGREAAMERDDRDDGSREKLDEIQYTKRGNAKVFTMKDIPVKPEEEEKHEDDMPEDEYLEKLKDDRGWANWKDDHEKGGGNPYYRE